MTTIQEQIEACHISVANHHPLKVNQALIAAVEARVIKELVGEAENGN